MDSFHADVLAELTRQGVINPRYVGKTWLLFCWPHKRKIDKFEGEGGKPSNWPSIFIVTACEECRFATVREEDWAGGTKRLIRIPERAPWRTAQVPSS